MVIHHQQMEGDGTIFVPNEKKPEGGHMLTQGKKSIGLWGKTALFILFLFGLALSVAFPYGIGFAVFLWIIALAGAVCGVGLICYGLFREILGKTATFDYSPAMSYMTGRKGRKKKKERSPKKDS